MLTTPSATETQPAPSYTVAVRTLCEFAARQGDLDLRFTPSPSARQGIAGHQAVAARRGAGYQAELALAGRYRQLQVRGRADGYDPDLHLLEEIKTFRGDVERVPANQRALHWAQAQVYGHLLCQQLGLAAITLALVYFDIATQQEAPPLRQHRSAAELQQCFETLCERFLHWADQETAHRAARDAALTTLPFAHDDFRVGQRQLAETVFRAARAGRCLLAQAPTGIGKTLGTVYPLLKACPAQATAASTAPGLDKLFFLTAKGSGRGLALAAVHSLRQRTPGLPLRVITLLARDKACEHPDKLCHGDSCPLAKGFYDRLPAARSAAIASAAQQSLTPERLRAAALAFEVCPYYLGQELVRWCDLVIADYNHFFDGHALLHGLALANGWQVAVLVDEAHNLLERARRMYSAELDQAAWRALAASAPLVLKNPLTRLLRCWASLGREHPGVYTVLPGPPPRWVAALQDVVAATSQYLAEPPTVQTAGRPADANSRLMTAYFEALQFCRLLDSFGPHSMVDLTRDPSSSKLTSLCLRNLLPAPFLQPRFAAAVCTVLFSATLTPRPFYSNTLGLPADTAWLDVAAPFRPEQLRVQIAHQVSTRFAHRAKSLAPIAALMASQFQARPGNYLAFFSSFDYLQQAADALAALAPQIPLWRQDRRMDEPSREAFLAHFAEGGSGIGFAVLGGVFAEGIDLAGSRLIGAFIATLGLPQINPLNEELRRRQQAVFGAGYDYTYLYPGLRKVVQAAGRVIRTPSDQGSLHLIDDRFARPEVRRLLPAWWRIEPLVRGQGL